MERNKHIPLDEKLAALQQADPERKWLSLDDHRVCALCGKVISGRMIDIWQDEHAAYHLHCPTPGCGGSPRDWHYHRAKDGLHKSVPNQSIHSGFRSTFF